MMAACVPSPRPDHAAVAAEMALDMLEAARALSAETGEEIALRIGLHSGPAVGGVIGTTKVFYDVWGDMVNTASRLESTGAADHIQVTAPARDALGPGYAFAPRGTIDIKDPGPTRTWWLSGRPS